MGTVNGITEEHGKSLIVYGCSLYETKSKAKCLAEGAEFLKKPFTAGALRLSLPQWNYDIFETYNESLTISKS